MKNWTGDKMPLKSFMNFMFCCRFMPKIQRRVKENYSDSDPDDLPPLTSMFNFFGYAKHDPTQQK
jgi:hypothetical protein